MTEPAEVAKKDQDAPWWAHGLVSVLSIVLTLLWLARSGEFPAVGRVAIAPPSPDPDLLAIVTPSEWLLRRVRSQLAADEARMRAANNGSLPHGDGYIEMMFETPIYRLNLRDLGMDPSEFNEEVAATVLEEYYNLVETRKHDVLRSLDETNRQMQREEAEAVKRDRLKLQREGHTWSPESGRRRLDASTHNDDDKEEEEEEEEDEAAMMAIDNAASGDARALPPTGKRGGASYAVAVQAGRSDRASTQTVRDEEGDTSAFNDAFFLWQVESGGWETMFGNHHSFKMIENFWGRAADHLLRSMGHPPAFEGKRPAERPEMQAWATVHRDCVFHGAHGHGEDLVSGVYYVQMPPGSGRIDFFDPRGIHAPFQGKITVAPSPGDIVLFPSSLIHQVTPTTGSSERISIAVNMIQPATAANMMRRGAGSDNMPSAFLNDPQTLDLPPIPPREAYNL